jgi:hypothetical protein
MLTLPLKFKLAAFHHLIAPKNLLRLLRCIIIKNAATASRLI